MPDHVFRKAESVLISAAEINGGPPVGFSSWSGDAILSVLRRRGIDVAEVVNWTRSRPPLLPGIVVYYYGESATPQARSRLH